MKEASFRGHKFKFDETTWKPYTQISWFITDPTGDIAHRDKFFWPREGEVVIDVGASCGGPYAIPAAMCGAQVFAFEPDPDTFKALERNRTVNGLEERMDLMNVAVCETDGRIAFNGSLLTSVYENPNIQIVDCMTIDRFYFPQVDWLKIDVEGARETIKRCKPKILIDLHPHLVPKIEHKILDWFNDLHLYYNTHITPFSDRVQADLWYYRTFHYIDK